MLRYILLLVVASIVPNAFAGVADDENLTRVVVFCRQLYFDKASNNYVYSVDNQKIKYLYNITKKIFTADILKQMQTSCTLRLLLTMWLTSRQLEFKSRCQLVEHWSTLILMLMQSKSSNNP